MHKDHDKHISKSAASKSHETAKPMVDSQPQGTTKQAAASAEKGTSDYKGNRRNADKHH